MFNRKITYSLSIAIAIFSASIASATEYEITLADVAKAQEIIINDFIKTKQDTEKNKAELAQVKTELAQVKTDVNKTVNESVQASMQKYYNELNATKTYNARVTNLEENNASAYKKLVIKKNGVGLRLKPTLSLEPMQIFDKGDAVEVIECDAKWCQTDKGYIYKSNTIELKGGK